MKQHKWHKEIESFKEFVKPYIHVPATQYNPPQSIKLDERFEQELYKKYQEHIGRVYETT
jgi:hypothetical protein